MTTNFENEPGESTEFSDTDLGITEEIDTKSGSVGNLAEAWRTRPLFKFTVLVIGVFAVGAAAIKFFSSGDSVQVSHLTKPPMLKEAPGGVASPYLRQQTELANDQRIQQALEKGGSAIPTPIGQSTDITNPNALAKEPDPLKELRAETDLLKKQVQQQRQQMQGGNRGGEQFDNSLAEAMQKQMQQLLSSWQAQGVKNVIVQKDMGSGSTGGRGASGAAGEGVSKDTGRDSSGSYSSGGAGDTKPLISAGTVSYAQMLTEANSDVPGPVLAQIVSGPLTGARAIGAFQVADGYEKYIVLKFNLADKSGKDYQINAIALDPDTTLGGMATEVDERYFTRVVLPAAAGFLQGLGQAMSQGNTSITTNGTTTITTQASAGFKEGMYNGLSTAANTVGQFFQQQANQTKPLVRIAAGTPFGMFFLAPVSPKTASGSYSAPQGDSYNVSYSAGGSEAAPSYSGRGGVPYPGAAAAGYSSASGRTNTVLPYVHQNY
jgi:intracellular multiplication protein IcmE